jgi:predicted aspartyl protease
VPFTPAGGVLVVPVVVNGVTARFLIDTGAERSVVTREAVDRLGLALDEWVATTMRGVGGIERHRNANPRSMTLGGVALRRHTVARDRSLTVATLPRFTLSPPVDGLLGRDFLAAFDLDLDMPARTLTLYDVAGCTERFLPWSGNYAALPVQLPMGNALVVGVQLDGVALRALLDTGASESLLVAPGMFKMGIAAGTAVHAEAGSSQNIAGLGPRVVVVDRHPFASLRVGPETLKAPSMLVAPVHLVPIVDMLLGGDWLAGKRLWISFATKQVFVGE